MAEQLGKGAEEPKARGAYTYQLATWLWELAVIRLRFKIGYLLGSCILQISQLFEYYSSTCARFWAIFFKKTLQTSQRTLCDHIPRNLGDYVYGKQSLDRVFKNLPSK